MGEANDVKGLISVLQLLIIVNGGNSNLALGHVAIVIDVIAQKKVSLHVWNKRLQQLVEDVIRSLNLLLLSDTRLLQQVGLNVTTAEFSRLGEVNPDEFTETGGVVIPRGLGITIRFQDRIGGYNLVLKGYLLSCRSFLRCGNSSQVGNDP